MISEKTYPVYSVKRHPFRTASIAGIAAVLAFSVFFTGIIIRDLGNGLNSLKLRLGADLIVVPSDAEADLNDILLTGSPGYFYMDKSVADQISSMDGVEQVTTQFYMTSSAAGCCDIPVQFIGFDPETDFVIRPWLEEDYPENLEFMQIIVGNYISIPENGILRFYDRDCEVIGRMAETGTGLDSTVFANTETILELMNASKDKGFDYLDATDPVNAISSVLIRTAEGTTPEQIRKTINKEMNGVRVITTQGMIGQFAGSISSLSKVMYIFAALTVIVAVVTLSALYSAIANERRHENGLLIVLGYSRRMLLQSMISEIVITSLVGTLAGLGLGFLFVLPFQAAIAVQLSLPFLTASLSEIVNISLVSAVITLIIGPISSLKYISGLRKFDAAELMKGY